MNVSSVIDRASRLSLASIALISSSDRSSNLLRFRKDNTLTGDRALASDALCVLDVSSNDVADEGITYLASVLAVLSVLTDLCVSHNGIGDRGVKALCRGLEQSTTMHELDLRSNVITDDGERVVSAMLRRRIPLLRVDLCHNRIGPEGDNWCF